jgi:N-acetylglutamate synthase-like GNAT family acetyltransferase
MPDQLTIRDAQLADAAPAMALVRRSIVRLCHLDHGGDRPTLEGWLANKTIENMEHWIERPGTSVFVAEREGAVVGVGAVTDQGEILLAYVDPPHRFSGVTKALVTRMEDHARSVRAERMQLTVTETARPLFLSLGYVAEEEPGDIFSNDQNVLIRPFDESRP